MRVVFHGHLATLCPEVYDMKVSSVQEALYAIVSQVPALQILRNGEGHPCRVMGFETVQDLYRHTEVEEIHIFPDYTVSKNGGLLQIGIGVLMVAASFFTGGTALAFMGPLLFKLGVTMILGGILALMAPQPGRDQGSRGVDPSRYLGGPKNTVEIGTRIPIGFGIYKLHGHYLSYDVNVVGTKTTGE